MATMETSVRDWYTATFPEDDLGPDMNMELTFQGLFDALDSYQDVYKTLGVGDSLVRERCFEELAQIIGTEYSYIYDQWLMGAEARRKHYDEGV
ncbi:MAG: hypothetical protein IJ240_10175 [Clostridia bacterium]|nr:hypothetical protein [Clostridia bacterium]